jgi:hypothetical protein
MTVAEINALLYRPIIRAIDWSGHYGSTRLPGWRSSFERYCRAKRLPRAVECGVAPAAAAPLHPDFVR